MLENHIYNLLNQLVQEHKSLWRIKRMYKRDAKKCKECKKLWEKLAQDKEKHIEDLIKLVNIHLK